LRDRGRHIVTSAIEHPAVTEVCRYLETEGFRVTYLPVDSAGLVDPAAVEKALTAETILVTIMHANNEVGVIQPIAEIAAVAHRRGVRVHSDGAQSVGKIPARVDELGVDLFSVAGHKMYAPKGIGALYQKRGTELGKLVHGADHEQNRRAGTENVLQIVGLGKACEIAARDLDKTSAHMRTQRDRLHEKLSAALPDLHLNGHPEKRLPNTLSVSFPGLEANTILDELTGIAASAGAACHADQVDVSHVLEAMGIPEHVAMGTLRLSVGRETSEEEIDRAAEQIIATITRMRGEEDAGVAPPIAAGEPIRLTHYTHGLGCACKIQPQVLEKIPRAFGAIAAANALSDIYAMGALPLFALNIVGFPVRRLPMQVLHEILAGASDVAAEAGIPIVGGHSVEDTEPKFGWAVTGIVHPDKVLANSGARPGDALVLTKPIGLGILATAAKRGAASKETIARCTEVMRTLNRAAAEVMADFPVSACTDITGFGLIGHLLEMTAGSGVEADVWAPSVPVLPEARDCAAAGTVPGGTRDNLDHAGERVTWDPQIPEIERLILCDAQTSGGLLISVPEERGAELLTALHANGVTDACRIGRIGRAGSGQIRVYPSDRGR
jgi:selenium donor protein